ncbi:MAG: hypothetical protein HQ481_16130 [Alphaproteobacteria bacterium]|nr:hypothetical protein [Alphaproteobacteria bacterium]
MSYSNSTASGGPEGGPPGQNLLGICLALLAAVLGTPYLFGYVGPWVERVVYNAYGSRELADVMYFASFGLSGVVIYAVCRMALWYALAAIVAFGAVRMAGMAAF